MNQPVTSHAEVGVRRLLRPPAHFLTTYQGVSAGSPIYFFEGGRFLDSQAGKPGYDPTLAAACSTPMGAHLELWFPNVFWIDDTEALHGYQWILIPRLRTLFDYRQTKSPNWHIPTQRPGALDTTAPAGQQARIPIPAGYETVSYLQAEPATETAFALERVHSLQASMGTVTVPGPLLPDGTEQAVEQGILDPAVIADANRAQFMIRNLSFARADEVLIAVRRDTTLEANWDFDTTDLRFAQFFGFPDTGVYLFHGNMNS